MVYQPIGKHLADLVFIALDEEPADRPVIGHAGIFVPDRRGKEFQEPARRLVAGIGDDRRHHDRSLDGREISGGLSAGTTVSARSPPLRATPLPGGLEAVSCADSMLHALGRPPGAMMLSTTMLW